MTPDELALITSDASALAPHRKALAEEFYATLFELDPSVVPLFPADMAAQHLKFADELAVLVELATALSNGAAEPLQARTFGLGHRHREYGTTAEHYVSVGEALLAALEQTVEGWDKNHRAAWSKIYRLVADAMQQAGASS